VDNECNNAAGVRAVERVGVNMEGALRWTRKQEGTDVVGTDRVMLAVCWDDWDGGVGEHVTQLIDSIWGSVRVKDDLYKICNPQRKFYKKK